MYHDRPDLAALIGSRICHDLISPLGAIGNGVELLAMAGAGTGAGDSAELRLIGDSVAAAKARIRFFRIAYGHAGAQADIGSPEILATLGDYFHGRKIAMTWQPREQLPRCQARRLFLAIQCVESALPFGGEIAVRRLPAGWEVAGQSTRLRADDLPWVLLAGGAVPAGLSPAQVQFALLGQIGGARAEIGESRVAIAL